MSVTLRNEIARLREVNAGLLAACEAFVNAYGNPMADMTEAFDMARAAIANARDTK